MSGLYIRFGVHKDRDVLKKMRDHMSGICIPAHILAYTPDPTKAAIFYAQKPFFIDPMTYRYSESDINQYVTLDKKDNKNKFKPSVKKLTQLYGLEDFFADRNYAPLTAQDVDDNFVNNLTQKVVELQQSMVDDKKESAVERYSELLQELGEAELVSEKEKEHKPEFYIPPYFFFESKDDPWFAKNIEFLDKTQELVGDSGEVVPMLLTNAASLDVELLSEYSDRGVNKIAVWLSDFEERSKQTGEVQKEKLNNYVQFAIEAQKKGIAILAMHSSYFSVALYKSGVDSICHGLLHGEYKNKKAQIGGGAPPARYYIRSIHNFLPVTSTQRLFSDPEAIDLLDIDSDPCMNLIGGDHKKIYDVFESNVPMSQMHFLHARNEEISFVKETNISGVITQLKDVYENKKQLVEKVSEVGCLDYLTMWADALSPLAELESSE